MTATQTEATLIYHDGRTLTHPAPYPLPEAILHVEQVFRGSRPEEESMMAKWEARVFLRAGESEPPVYREDERRGQPTYATASSVRQKCYRCRAESEFLYVLHYPRRINIKPEDAEAFCQTDYAATYAEV